MPSRMRKDKYVEVVAVDKSEMTGYVSAWVENVFMEIEILGDICPSFIISLQYHTPFLN